MLYFGTILAIALTVSDVFSSNIHILNFYNIKHEPGELSPYSNGLRAGWSGFESRQFKIILFSTTIQTASEA